MMPPSENVLSLLKRERALIQFVKSVFELGGLVERPAEKAEPDGVNRVANPFALRHRLLPAAQEADGEEKQIYHVYSPTTAPC